MTRFKTMNPEAVMTVVISVIILAVGVFAFFITIDNIPTPVLNSTAAWAEGNRTQMGLDNISGTAGQVFNVVGVVIIIGAIMTIVGVVYAYTRPGGY